MKTLFTLSLLLLSWNVSGQAFPQVPQLLTYTVTATNLTPTDIAGERQLITRFNVRKIRNLHTPPPRVNQAELYYSTDRALLETINSQVQSFTANVGVSIASIVSGTYSVTFAHADNQAPSGSVHIPEDNLGHLIIYKKDTQVFFKWRVGLSDNKFRLMPIDSFIMPRALNIAIIGDSYASGEGAPKEGTAPWIDSDDRRSNHHRSQLGGEFKALQQFKNDQRGLAIRCDAPLYVACSGSGISQIVETAFNPNFCDQVNNSLDSAQLNQLVQLFQDKKYDGGLDGLVVATGGNDVGFAETVENAFWGQLSNNISPLASNIPRLDTVYREMANRIDGLCVRHVFVMPYPDPTHKQGLPANLTLPNQLTNVATFGGLPDNAIDFLVKALIESSTAEAQNQALALCNLGEDLLDTFLGGNRVDDCANVSIFQHPSYDAVQEYINCQAGNLDNYADLLPAAHAAISDIGRIKLLAEVLHDFLRCLALGDSDLLACTVSCAGREGSGVSFSSLFSTFLATQRDLQAAHNRIILPMNNVFENICTSRPNWHFVGGTMRASRDHGLCSCWDSPRYFNSMLASYSQQGSYYGTAHMNHRGQQAVYANLLLPKLEMHLLPRGNRKIRPSTEDCMHPVPPFSDSTRRTFNDMDAATKQMEQSIIQRLMAFRSRHLEAIKVIVDVFDPKKFAGQFMERGFDQIRRNRK